MKKRKNGKRRQKLISASWFSFPQYTWPLSRCIQNLKTLALIEDYKSVIEFFIGEREKEKWINKGNDKQEEADSLLHNTTFVSNFKILGSVVPEKSLMKNKVYTQTQTHTITEKTKSIYPLYTSYAGGITRALRARRGANTLSRRHYLIYQNI